MPGLLSSPVCLTVIWFLSWSLRPSCAQIQTDEVSGVQYGRLESNVTLACRKSQMRLPVMWQLNNTSALPWHKLTPDGSLVLLHVNHSAQGEYTCYDSQGLLLHSIKLYLGHLPGLLSVSCQVPNHTHVRCSWVDSVTTFLPAKYDASIRGNGQEWVPCNLNVARKHCDVDYPAFWQTIHTLRITETNGLGSMTTYSRFKLHELLKPDPPESVSAEGIDNHSKRLNISWSFPSSWPLLDAFPLVFHIRYKPVGSVHWSEIFSEENSVIIFDALAGHFHQVQVRARDEVNSHSQWSDWSPPLLVMPWNEPTTVYTTHEPGELDFITKTETFTAVSHNPELDSSEGREEGNLGMVILLAVFSVVILTTILSLIFVVWVRQMRQDHVTIQELTSMVKIKSMPI
ncbi:uncharacterized protein V6R79_004599 [Siganus canaliculatus]